jgi:hypothetical protein
MLLETEVDGLNKAVEALINDDRATIDELSTQATRMKLAVESQTDQLIRERRSLRAMIDFQAGMLGKCSVAQLI